MRSQKTSIYDFQAKQLELAAIFALFSLLGQILQFFESLKSLFSFEKQISQLLKVCQHFANPYIFHCDRISKVFCTHKWSFLT